MRRHNLYIFIKSVILMQIFLLVLMMGVSYDLNQNYLACLAPLKTLALWLPFSRLDINEHLAASMFAQNSVAMARVTQEESSWREYLYRRVPENLMASNLHVLASRGAYPYPERANQVVEPITEPLENEQKPDQTGNYAALMRGHSVFFYCTHSAESYIPDSGQARCEGERGLVNQVAATIASSLREAGVVAEYIDTIHDSPDYNQSYANSRETVKTVLKFHNDIMALFDIHRDSIPGQQEGETINIDGKPAARILIIVGTDERKPHPHWKENMEFAQKLYSAGEKMYPGLIKGIRTKAGTYNQEFFPHALLLEFGNDTNSYSEAAYTAKLFSAVLLDVLGEEVKQ